MDLRLEECTQVYLMGWVALGVCCYSNKILRFNFWSLESSVVWEGKYLLVVPSLERGLVNPLIIKTGREGWYGVIRVIHHDKSLGNIITRVELNEVDSPYYFFNSGEQVPSWWRSLVVDRVFETFIQTIPDEITSVELEVHGFQGRLSTSEYDWLFRVRHLEMILPTILTACKVNKETNKVENILSIKEVIKGVGIKEHTHELSYLLNLEPEEILNESYRIIR